MLSQNAGNESGIIQGLDAVISHPFGDHSSCGKWCNFVSKKKASYSSHPYGKPLNDLALKSALSDLVKPFQKHAKKLIRLGSTQGNESLNRIISSKAPKTHHYSSSASFNFRLAADIALKNLGESYVLDVHRRIGLSPGCNARMSFLLRDLQRKKRKAVATTAKTKRRRIVLKNQRSKHQGTTEVREGPSYESGIEMKSSESPATEIPAATGKPVSQALPSTTTFTEVYFDLETTGLEEAMLLVCFNVSDRTSHITQLAARRGEDVFFS